MDKFSQNTPSELLNLMLDGEIPLEHSDTLYQSLAADPALQAEMNELLSIRSAVQNDTEAYTPPVESKSIIFERLGIAQTDATATLPIAAGSSSMLSKLLVPTASAIVASLLTTLVFVYWGSNDASLGQQNSDLTAKFSATNQVANNIAIVDASSSENNVVAKSESNRSSANANNTNRYFANNASGSVNKAATNKNIANDENAKTINAIDEDKNLGDTQNAMSMLDLSNINQIDELNSDDVFATNGIRLNKMNLSNLQSKNSTSANVIISASGMSGSQNFNSESVSSYSVGAYALIPVSILGIESEMNYGIRIGSEDYMIAVSPDDNSTAATMNKQGVIWGVASARLVVSEVNLFGLISPFAQLEAGFTTHGALTKEIVGLQISPEFKVLGMKSAITAAYELGQLYQTNYNNTAKNSGLNFGIILKF